MTLASRILTADDLKKEEVTIPEWDNVTVIVRAMTGTQRAQFVKDNDKHGVYVAMLRALMGSVLDPETMKPVFEPAHQDDLTKKNGTTIDQLFLVLAKISGLNPQGVAEAEKNSQPANEDSTSSSPNSSTVQ